MDNLISSPGRALASSQNSKRKRSGSPTKKPECPQKMSFLDLPEEMLENIVKLLDPTSVMAFAMTSAVLRQRIAHLCTEIKTRLITKLILDFAASNFNHIKTLDLNSCRANPFILEDLILRCRHVRELKVVNCGLTFPQLLRLLKSLECVESLAFCFFDVPENDTLFVDTYPSIRKVYLEAAPLKSFSPILDFLNSCVKVEFVHIAFIGREQSRNNYRSPTCRIDEGVWTTLHTVLFSCHQVSGFSRRELAAGLIDICSANTNADNKFWVRECMQFYQYVRGDRVSNTATEMVACKNISILDNTYGLSLKPRSDEIRDTPFRLTEIIPQHMVELDLTGCHGPFPKESWESLVENAPNLEALAVPVCFLPRALDSLAGVSEENATAEQKLRARMHAANCCVVNALKKIRLKRLHCTGVPPTVLRSCDQCRISWMSYTIGELEMLPYLEELTMTKIKTPHLTFGNLVNSRMKVARLSFVEISSIQDLKPFVERCTNLEFLKIGAVDLPLEKPMLWEALASGTKLKQICISPETHSNSVGIRHEMVRYYLPKLLKTIEVFHLHISSIGESFSKLIQELIANENSTRKTNKIHYLQPPCPTLSYIEFVNLIQAVPGRALCCSTSFIGKIPLEGWIYE